MLSEFIYYSLLYYLKHFKEVLHFYESFIKREVYIKSRELQIFMFILN